MCKIDLSKKISKAKKGHEIYSSESVVELPSEGTTVLVVSSKNNPTKQHMVNIFSSGNRLTISLYMFLHLTPMSSAYSSAVPIARSQNLCYLIIAFLSSTHFCMVWVRGPFKPPGLMSNPPGKLVIVLLCRGSL